MKPTMLFAITMLTAIVLMTMFNLTLSPTTPIVLSATESANALYVCPAASTTWDSIATSLHPLVKWIVVGFFFAVIMLLFSWGWAMYQNLLKDKFNRDSFKKPWGLTKFTFWTGIILTLLIVTPNHFRTVHLTGDNRAWVLCDSNTPGARPVHANAVHR